MYAYAVLSLVEGNPKNVISFPLLGIHRSEQEAQDHFEMLLNDRSERKLDLKTFWDLKHARETEGRKRELRRAYLSYSEPFSKMERTETFIIERWNLNY